MGSHAALDVLFQTAGAPGDPPNLSHESKWKEWLFRAGLDPDVDSLAVLGNILEEFMDLPPMDDPDAREARQSRRIHGMQYAKKELLRKSTGIS